MATLIEIVLGPENRPRVVKDAAQLVDSEVRSKGGISGIAIKAGFKAVTTIRPTLVDEAVDSLLDRFVERLEPFYADWVSKGKSPAFDSFLSARANQVANALLAVTDERARQTVNNTIRKTYEKLRPMGEKNVEAAIPGLGRVLNRYVNKI